MVKPAVRVTDAITARAILEQRAQQRVAASRKLFEKKTITLSDERLKFYLDRCHEKQREALLDSSERKALICPRRTGKTTYTLFETMLHAERFPGSTIAYIVPDSKQHARRLFWRPLQQMNEKLRLGLEFKEVEKRVITPWSTDILLFAAHDSDSPTALRGDAYSLVMLDECKDFGPHFEELVIEAVMPGLDDYGGTLAMAGTPGSILEGMFYRVTTGQVPGWSVKKWIKSDNTYLRPEARDLPRIAATMGLTMDSPKFRREQLAEWIPDDAERGYYYDSFRNGWDGILNPNISWDYICGVDIGKRDKTVFTVAAFSQYDPHLYFVDCFAQSGMTIESIASKWRTLNSQYAFVSTVADTGGLGVMIVDHINERWGCGWKPADKKPSYKLSAVEAMNSDFVSGRIKAASDTILTRAWARSVKDPKTQLPMHSDEADAALYTFRESYHWTGTTPETLPIPGSKEYWQSIETESINKAVRAHRNRNNWMSNAPSDQYSPDDRNY